MSEASLFDRVADKLDDMTDLSRLESRGTLRIVLKKAGFEPRSVSPADLGVILKKLLPEELVARGIDDAEDLSAALAASVSSSTEGVEVPETPDMIFRRLTS